ncbi:MAG TPA: nitronate monooxygenase family protein [Nitrospirota bacterium]|nr:nitronate monooxygenase family protein [Nitrospirota bacterium]
MLRIGRHTPVYPLIQGGMGVRISASRLAGAVARAGGVGTIASVGLGLASHHFTGKNYFEANKMALAEELAAARKTAPDGIIAVNCMVALTDYEAMVRASAENGAQVIISGAGLPLQLPEYTKDHPDVALVPIVSSVKAAALIIKKWEKSYKRLPDALVVEAPGAAGGHLGARADEVFSPELTLERVVPELVEFLEGPGYDIPVVAAGGIWDRGDMVRAFSMGARGVQMGTRFVCTHECDAPDAFKQAYLDATEADITLIKSPVGLPGRAIRNAFSDKLADGPPEGHRCLLNCIRKCSFRAEGVGFCIAMALSTAQGGDVARGLIFSGSNSARCSEIVPVSDVIEELFGAKDTALEAAPACRGTAS